MRACFNHIGFFIEINPKSQNDLIPFCLKNFLQCDVKQILYCAGRAIIMLNLEKKIIVSVSQSFLNEKILDLLFLRWLIAAKPVLQSI